MKNIAYFLTFLQQKHFHQLKGVLLLFSCLLFTFCSIKVFSGEPLSPFKFQRYTVNDGLSQGTILSMHQDKKGFIWLGTENGLNRFDGYEFVQFKSIKGHDIRAITESSEGDLWVGTTDALNVLRSNKEEFETVKMAAATSIKGKNIQALTFDESGILWIGTAQGLFKKIPGAEIEKVVIQESQISENKLFIVSITEVTPGIIWVGTAEGVIEINNGAKTQKLILFNGDNNNIHIRAIFKNSKDDIWIATFGNGLFRLQYNDPNITRYQAPQIIENRIYAISEDSQGRMWFGMDTKGMQIFEYGKGFYLLTHDPADPQSISGNAIEKILLANNGDVWVGTTRTGLNQHKLVTENFTHLKNRTNTSMKLLSNDVISIGVDGDQRLWIGTFGEGWAILDIQKQQMNYITAENGLVGNHPKDIVIGNNGFIWLCSEVGITKVNAMTLQVIETYISNNSGFTGGQITSAIDDNKGNLWLGHFGGGFSKFTKADSSFTLYNTTNSQLPSDTIDKLLLSTSGDIWIATRSGLVLYSPLNDTFSHYPKHNDGRNYYFNDITLDSDGSMWIASPKGVHRFNTSTMLYEKNIAIVNEPTYKLLTDLNGFSWLSTNNGLLRLDTNNEPSMRLTHNDGVQAGEFYGGVGIVMSDGTLAFGGTDGATIFHPNSVNPQQNKVNIAQISIQSNSGSHTNILNNMPDNLNLPASSLGLTLSLSSLNFDSVNNIKYRYRETDGKWLSAQGNKIYIPANKSGHFTYHLASTNAHGEWQQASEKFTLSIATPWYLHSFTISIYIAFLLLVIYIAYRIRVRKLNEKSAELESLVQARTAELASSNRQISLQTEELKLAAVQKTHLFETISHELRTPITLILGPVRQLSKQLTDEKLRDTTKLIERNTTRLNRLVNQLLDLSRSESSMSSDTDSKVNLSKIVLNLVASFKPYAADASISLNVDCKDEIMVAASDDDAEKIISNLLANAIKYSPTNGSVLVVVSQQKNTAIIKVIDTGIGMASKHLDDIFRRFHRIDAEKNATIEGSGIGLSIVKSIVDNVGGKIEVRSKLGAGSTFTVELPLNDSNQEQHKILPAEVINNELVNNSSINDTEIMAITEQPCLLLVDDNNDILIYVSSLLSDDYNITTATNGEDGIQKAKEIIPDIIISDIMMPGIDGLELLETLKKDELTNHIPIIMLTAKGGTKLDGLKLHADDYLAKPFNEDELSLRLRNLLAARDIIKQKFASEYHLQPVQSLRLEQKSDFITKLDSIIEKGYQDSLFSVTMLAKEAAVGERQLLRKLKAETNMGAKEYIRTYRLKKAAILMLNGNSASSVANDVGFSSQAYFSSCFKAFYNQTPSQYSNNKRSA